MADQAISGFKDLFAHFFVNYVTASVNGQYADAIAFTQAGFTDGLTDHLGARWDNDLGNTGPAGVKQTAKGFHPGLQTAVIIECKTAHNITATHYTQYGAYPDHFIGRRCHAGLVRVADGQ